MVLAERCGEGVAALLGLASQRGKSVRIMGAAADVMGAVVSGEVGGVIVVEVDQDHVVYAAELIEAMGMYYPNLPCAKYVCADDRSVGELIGLSEVDGTDGEVMRFEDYVQTMRKTDGGVEVLMGDQQAIVGELLKRKRPEVIAEDVLDEGVEITNRFEALTRGGASLSEEELTMLLGPPEVS